MFEYIFAFAFLLVIYAHSLLIREIKVDKIYPECFRTCKYGACDYYKEFYDPITHKTAQPFHRELRKNEAIHFVSLERNDYNLPFNVQLKGRQIENEGKPFTDYVKRAKFEPFASTDKEWIIKHMDTPSIIHPDAGISTITKKDLVEDLRPLI